MKREVGFYVMIPGLSIYSTLILVLYFYPVVAAYNGHLSGDDIIMYVFMVLFFYPISLGLVAIGDEGAKIINWKWVLPISSLPIVISAGLVGYFIS